MTIRPLQGLKVLDLTRVVAGPWCTQLLGDLGADVVKVERAGVGDDARAWPPFFKNEEGTRVSGFFMMANRGKRSAAFDFANPEDQESLRGLAAKADVFVENFKVGDLKRYGLDYETLKKTNPGLVYCSITGFGQDGPYSDRPGYDLVVQGMGGLMDITGYPDSHPGGGPMKSGVAITDIMTGMYASSAILAALRGRDATGVGCHIDTSLLDVQVATLAHQAFTYFANGEPPKRSGNASTTLQPYDAFAAADGYMVIAVGNDGQFAKLCEAIGHPEIAANPDYAKNSGRMPNQAALKTLLEGIFKEKPVAHWLSLIEGVAPAGPVNRLDQVFADPQVQHRNMKWSLPDPVLGSSPALAAPIRYDGEQLKSWRAAPPLGADTDAVLADWLGKGE